jgi:hypothetical protein
MYVADHALTTWRFQNKRRLPPPQGCVKHCCHFHSVLKGHLITMNVPLPRKVPLLSLEELFGFSMLSEIFLILKF